MKQENLIRLYNAINRYQLEMTQMLESSDKGSYHKMLQKVKTKLS